MTDLELLKDRIEETTWYHIHNGKLVEGANGEEDEPLDFREEQEFNDRWE